MILNSSSSYPTVSPSLPAGPTGILLRPPLSILLCVLIEERKLILDLPSRQALEIGI